MKRRAFLKYGIAGMSSLAMADQSWALQFYPTSMDKKWAILYGTWCGSSRDAAVWISEGMGGIADVFDVRETPDLKSFDHIVIGGSIRSGKVPGKLQTYLKDNKDKLKSKIRGYFIICGNRQQPVTVAQKTTFIDNHLAKITGVNDVPSKIFLGRITLSLMEPQSRQAIERMGIMDYDNMHRKDFLNFGKTFLTVNRKNGN